MGSHTPIVQILAPLISFWGYIKNKEYQSCPQTIQELKENIRAELQAIPATTCSAFLQNFVRRLELCGAASEMEGTCLEQLQ